jgi:hypothetical protein
MEVQLSLDEGIRGAYNTMYQRELKIQKGLKNKVQLQFKNADQKPVRIKGASTNTSIVTSSSFSIELATTANIRLGMYPTIVGDDTVFQTGTYISDISGTTVTIANQNPAYNPETDQFLSPVLKDIPAGTNITFNQNFVFNMYDSTNNNLLIRKELEVTDDGITTATRGLALLTLSENDTRNLETTYYTFGITQTDNDGANLATYSNTYYGINGTLKLTADLFPMPKPTQQITNWQKYYNSNAQLYNFYTGNLRAYPELNEITTVAVFLNAFKGTVKIQGTLENNPGTFANYTDIAVLTYATATTKVVYQNAIGKWSDVRVLWIPSTDGVTNYYSPQMPGNPTPSVEYFPNGKIDKVQYRS